MKINELQLRNIIKESVVKFLKEEIVARHASDRKPWEFTPGDTKFNYMLLSRLQMDCDYFLGYGNRYEKDLWAGNVDDHIEMMKKIWNGFQEKPEWLSMEQIEDYERKMKNNDTNNDIDGMKINESQLRKIIKESFKKVLNEYNSTFMSSTERAAQEFIDAFDSNEPEKSDFKTMERAMNHMSAYDFVGVDKYEMDEIREINKTLRELGLYY